MKDHLEQKIAQFFLQVRCIARRVRFLNGVEGLISLFDKVLRKRCIRLFCIPRTTPWGAKTLHDGDKLVKFFGHKENLSLLSLESLGSMRRQDEAACFLPSLSKLSRLPRLIS